MKKFGMDKQKNTQKYMNFIRLNNKISNQTPAADLITEQTVRPPYSVVE